MEDAGMHVDIISTEKNNKVKAWDHDHWSIELPVDVKIENTKVDDYDMLVISGGVINPDKMKANRYFVYFAKTFLESGKSVAAICHGPQLLIETGLLEGRRITSYPSIQTELKNAGAN